MILVDSETPFEPAKFVGLIEGEAHVIDGARIHANDDSVQSLIRSHQRFGTRDWFVLRQIDSSQDAAVDEVMHAFLAEELQSEDLPPALSPEQIDPDAERLQSVDSADRHLADWLTLSDPAMAVAVDVLRLRNHPDVPADIEVHGYLYDRNGERLIRLEI